MNVKGRVWKSSASVVQSAIKIQQVAKQKRTSLARGPSSIPKKKEIGIQHCYVTCASWRNAKRLTVACTLIYIFCCYLISLYCEALEDHAKQYMFNKIEKNVPDYFLVPKLSPH